MLRHSWRGEQLYMLVFKGGMSVDVLGGARVAAGWVSRCLPISSCRRLFRTAGGCVSGGTTYITRGCSCRHASPHANNAMIGQP